MKIFWYLYATQLKNNFKKALRKPVAYILTAIIILNVFSLGNSFGEFPKMLKVSEKEFMIMLLSIASLFLIPMSLISYSKRKGIVFTNSDVSLLFTMPISPKKVLLYAYLRNNIKMFIFVIFFIMPIGIIALHVSVWRVLCYVFLIFLLENVLESSLVIIIYGNDSFRENTMKGIRLGMKLFLVACGILTAYMIFNEEIGVSFILDFVNHPVIQSVPYIGWVISGIQLIFNGPDMVNVVNTTIFFISAVVFVIFAFKMKCTGLYYEDACKFADDYAEALSKSKKGQLTFIGQHKKYGKAEVHYKKKGAKAIYYRQLLEYKKQRFFIFDIKNIIYMAAGIISIILVQKLERVEYANFFLCGFGAYMLILTNGFTGKWKKELESPYTYLIPDSDFSKLWYATVLEHIQGLINAILLTFPAVFYFKISPVKTILVLVVLMCLNTNKIFTAVVAEVVVGKTFGNFGKQFFHLMLQSICIGFSVGVAIPGVMIWNIETGFIMMILITVQLSFCAALVGASQFAKMERNN